MDPSTETAVGQVNFIHIGISANAEMTTYNEIAGSAETINIGRVVRAACALADMPFVEAIVHMGVSHLLERGGMSRYPAPPHEPAYFLSGALTDTSLPV